MGGEQVRKDMHQAQDSIGDDPDALSWDLAWNGLFPGYHGGAPAWAQLRALNGSLEDDCVLFIGASSEVRAW